MRSPSPCPSPPGEGTGLPLPDPGLQVADRELKNVKALQALSRGASWVAMLFGCFGLVGWAFNVGALKQVFAGLPAMMPNTALSFVLAGGSLWVLRRPA